MIAGKSSDERHLIPRWRSVRHTIAAGEFQRLSTPFVLTDSQMVDLETSKANWNSEGSKIAASEFVGACVVAGEYAQAASAAEFLLSLGDDALVSLAVAAQSGADGSASQPASTVSTGSIEEYFRTEIARGKRRVGADPRDAISWADLARRYTALGQVEKARHALRVARLLAPSSRYLLRVTTRFLVHIGEPERALGMLASSPRTQRDPWLMAASIGVAGIAGKRLSGMKAARRVLEDQNFRLIERSELAAELATHELSAGADKKSRKLFLRSIADPTDNSLAQAEWASRKLTRFDLDLNKLDIPFASEARSRSSAESGDWSEALAEAMLWLDDQPFDHAAAVHASYVALVGLDDWGSGVAVAKLGLRANAGDPTLQNNLAYAHIESGELQMAADVLGQVGRGAMEPRLSVALMATRGLLEFRLGNHEQGRRNYDAAIKAAQKAKDHDREAMARSMLLREELRVGKPGQLDELVSLLKSLVPRISDPGVRRAVLRSMKSADHQGGAEK